MIDLAVDDSICNLVPKKLDLVHSLGFSGLVSSGGFFSFELDAGKAF